ncbi:MAG: MalY/PatB family protein, partial [Thermoplasmata archaeon]
MATKKFDFDEVIDRKGTGSVKWDFLAQRFSSDDLLPLWVADMDFRAPQPLVDALTRRAQHGIYGYSNFTSAYYDAVINWYRRRYDWNLKREWMVFTPGVVPAISLAVRAFSNPGEKIIVQTPVYYPFFKSIESNGRYLLNNPLILKDGHYEMDFEDLEKKVRDPKVRMIILCNPHNPVGRVWKKEELKRLGDICIDNGILVISDEIHSDIRYPEVDFTNFASISEKFANNSITCTAATKTFNLAGLQISNIIIPNQKIRQIFQNMVDSTAISGPNAFSEEAVRTAYNECEDWLDELLIYLRDNKEFLKEFIKEHLPQVDLIEPEGTYLAWLDFRKIEPDPSMLEKLMQSNAKVALDEGYIFGSGGEGFERINLACPRSILEKALIQIADAVENYKKTK